MEFHREKHLVPFLWAGSNVRRQNAAQWVNLQLLPPRSCHDHQSAPFLTPVPLSKASAYVHNFTISSGRLDRAASHAVITGEYSVSHTLCIMFASFCWTNTATANAAICSPGRIFNYFSHPWHLVVGATSGTGTRGMRGFQKWELQTLASELSLTHASTYTHSYFTSAPSITALNTANWISSRYSLSLSLLINIIFLCLLFSEATNDWPQLTNVCVSAIKQSIILVCFPKIESVAGNSCRMCSDTPFNVAFAPLISPYG